MGNDNRNNGGQEPDLNQILKNKREKLANLQAAGKDPFVITKYDQTDHTADAKAAYEALTADQKAIFLNASEYVDMVARLAAWANANQEAFVGGEFINAANGLNINQNNINLLAMIAIASIVISLSCLLIVAALRKRKKQ